MLKFSFFLLSYINEVEIHASYPPKSFLDMGFKCSYTLNLSELVKMEVNAGVKNIFDAYQDDIDLGAGRDSAYIYGPAMPRTIFFGVKLSM
jgi:outer membrane receptor for ferrienterochelin and colicins